MTYQGHHTAEVSFKFLDIKYFLKSKNLQHHNSSLVYKSIIRDNGTYVLQS